MKVTRTAGGVVLNRQGQVLVVNQNRNSWSLPKGHIDPGEDALTAAQREIYEESGVKDLTLLADLGEYERYKISLDGGDDMSERKRLTFFLFSTEQMELAPVDPHNPEARWLNVDEVAGLLTHSKDQEFFNSVTSTIQSYLK